MEEFSLALAFFYHITKEVMTFRRIFEGKVTLIIIFAQEKRFFLLYPLYDSNIEESLRDFIFIGKCTFCRNILDWLFKNLNSLEKNPLINIFYCWSYLIFCTDFFK